MGVLCLCLYCKALLSITKNIGGVKHLSSLSKTEQVALRLIQSDLQFLYTVYQNKSVSGSSYFVALLPYMGMIIDGCETWSNKVAKLKLHSLKFSEEEQYYYSKLRNSIKLWETSFEDLYVLLKQKYNESDIYFSNCCKPIAKALKLYDIFGGYLIDGRFCDNTILDILFVPNFDYNGIDGEYIKRMSIFSGKIIASFGIDKGPMLEVDSSIVFNNEDYGGFIKSPVGNNFSDKFVLFSILCTVNFIIYGIDKYIVPDTTTKLRLAYIQYYYLLEQIPQINKYFNTQFYMNNQWLDSQGTFRNCMAHYGIGVVLSQQEVIETDLFGGLTQKIFGEEWISIKKSIISELSKLSEQISNYLRI